jgi:hypothetical protein
MGTIQAQIVGHPGHRDPGKLTRTARSLTSPKPVSCQLVEVDSSVAHKRARSECINAFRIAGDLRVRTIRPLPNHSRSPEVSCQCDPRVVRRGSG